MSDFDVKQHLDYAGLQEYDYLLKNWVKSLNTSSTTDLQEKITALEEKVGDEKVEEVVQEAIASIIDSAPATFDTLKEVADWIEEHGEAAAALLESVSALGERVDAVNAKTDAVYNAIQSIPSAYIEALFLEPVAYTSSKTVTEQIAALQENEKLVIDAGSASTVSEDIAINKDCVIEAEGVDFSGTITVTEGVSATVIGATFSGEVVVQ